MCAVCRCMCVCMRVVPGLIGFVWWMSAEEANERKKGSIMDCALFAPLVVGWWCFQSSCWLRSSTRIIYLTGTHSLLSTKFLVCVLVTYIAAYYVRTSLSFFGLFVCTPPQIEGRCATFIVYPSIHLRARVRHRESKQNNQTKRPQQTMNTVAEVVLFKWKPVPLRYVILRIIYEYMSGVFCLFFLFGTGGGLKPY